MQDGFHQEIDNKHLYVLDIERNPIYCITKIKQPFEIYTAFNGTGYLNFDIIYSDKYKEAYNYIAKGKRVVYLRLEDYGEFIIDNVNETTENGLTTLKVECKDSQHKWNDRNFTLPDTVVNGNSVNRYANKFAEFNSDGTIDTTKESVLRRIFDYDYGGFPDWSSNKNLIDSELDLNKIMTFKGIKNQNLYKFIYENIEQTYDLIPFFDSLNNTLQFKLTKNAIDDTGIVLGLENFISSFVKESVCDTFCTRMLTEGGNLKINRANPDGGSYLYDYSNFYWMMDDGLISRLENHKNTCKSYENEYKEKFALLNEAQTNYDLYSSQFEALSPMHMQMNQAWVNADAVYGEDSVEAQNARTDYYNWVAESGFDVIARSRIEWGSKVNERKPPVDAINNICKRSNFLLPNDYKILSRIDTDANYKQEAFSYTNNMTESQKGDIAMLLKEYAEEELKRYNRTRYTFTIKLSNFCKINGCENFASQLNVGKYITLKDVHDNLYQVVVVGIKYNQANPQDLELTLSDKLSEHEFFPKLNDYLNNIIKTQQDVNDLQNDIDDIRGDIRDVNTTIGGVQTQVTQIQNVLGDIANKGFNTKNINVNNSDSSIILTFKDNGTGENAKVLTYTLAKTNKKITKINGNGLDISVTYGVL